MNSNEAKIGFYVVFLQKCAKQTVFENGNDLSNYKIRCSYVNIIVWFGNAFCYFTLRFVFNFIAILCIQYNTPTAQYLLVVGVHPLPISK